jgi:hypothetical protein
VSPTAGIPGGDASHREPVAIFTGEVLPQYAGDLDDSTMRKLLDDLAEEMGQPRIYISKPISYGGAMHESATSTSTAAIGSRQSQH